MQIVAPADMPLANEDLRKCAPSARALDHLGLTSRVEGRVKFRHSRTFALEQRKRSCTVRAEGPSVDCHWLHSRPCKTLHIVTSTGLTTRASVTRYTFSAPALRSAR